MYTISFTLRLDEYIYDKLKEEACRDRRSLNAHINYILQEYINKKDDMKSKENKSNKETETQKVS